MVTLVYKMTHKSDPDPELGWWGVSDCMGQVRSFPFDAVIGIGGRSWWTTETNRTGDIVWAGLGPEVVDQEERGPVLRFAHFRYFREGEQIMSEIAPKLDRSMQNSRFRLYGFSRVEEEEIERILRLARKVGPSTELFKKPSQRQGKGDECHPKTRRKKASCT